MFEFSLLNEQIDLFLLFIITLLVGLIIRMILLNLKKESVLGLIEHKLFFYFEKFKSIAQLFYQELDLIPAIMTTFSINLLFTLLVVTIGSIFILPSLIIFFLIGFGQEFKAAANCKLSDWILAIIWLIKISVFIIAAITGANIGLTVFTGGVIAQAINYSGRLFLSLVIPLQFVGALLEVMAYCFLEKR